MIALRRILCPIDFSKMTRHALRPAISLATEYGADLFLLHVLDFPYRNLDAVAPGYDIMAYYKEMQKNAERHLDELVEADAREFAPTHTVVRRGPPFLEIINLAKEENIDLIVMPTRGRIGMSRFLLGSVAEQVVRMSACPVLTISPREKIPEGFSLGRVLHPTDFSDYSDCALPYALSFAERYDAELLLLHVVTLFDSDPANPEWRFPSLPPENLKAGEEEARKSLEKCGGDSVPETLEVRRRLVRGFDPSREIANVADEEKVDLIVMATHGRTGLQHVLLGSTAEKLVRYSACPVLTVKHPEHEFVLP